MNDNKNPDPVQMNADPGRINHDITLEQIEAECVAHQKENAKRNIRDECRDIAKLQKQEQSSQFLHR